MKKEYEKQVLEMCEKYKDSILYKMIKERIEYLVYHVNDGQAMIDYLKNSFEEDNNLMDPGHMLGYLNTLKKTDGCPSDLEL